MRRPLSAGAFGPYLLVAGGALWRLVHTPLARFTGDEASFFHTAARIASLDAHPALGPPVSGTSAHHPGPLFYDLIALGAVLWRHPLACSAVVVLVASVSLATLVAFVRRTRGETAAWAVATVGALGPWPVLYADRPWNSNVAPWLAWLGLFFLEGAVRRRTRATGWWVGALVCLALLPQFHLSAPVAWAAAAAWWWRAGHRPPPRRALLIGAVLVGTAYAPALVWDLTHQAQNLRALLHRGARGHAPLRSLADVFYYLWAFGGLAIGYHVRTGYWGGYSPWQAFDLAPPLTGWYGPLGVVAVPAAGALVVAGLAVEIRAAAGVARRSASHGDGPGQPGPDLLRTGLVAGLLAALALLAASHKPVYPHYVNLLLPLVLVWPARGAAALVEATRGAWRGLAVAALAALALEGAWLTHRYYAEVDDLVGVATTEASVETVASVQRGRPFSLRFHTFPNGFAWRVMARDVLGVPWNAARHAADTWDVWPHRPAGLDAEREVWRVGPLWLVRHGEGTRAAMP